MARRATARQPPLFPMPRLVLEAPPTSARTLRTIEDPNVVERSALYLAAPEFIDGTACPGRRRRIGT